MTGPQRYDMDYNSVPYEDNCGDWVYAAEAKAAIVTLHAMVNKLLEVCKGLCETTHSETSEINVYVCPFCGEEWDRNFDGAGKLVSETIEHGDGCSWVRARAAIADAEKP